MPDLEHRGPVGLNLLTATEASQLLESGAATSAALVEACLARIEARNRDVHAWCHVDREQAMAQARARDSEPRRGPLHGVPVGIKDIFDTHDMPTTYGSAIYAGFRPAVDTAAVALLRLAGAVILGKCVTTEFASPVPAGVCNPHDLARTPGVSSSGSAAAVADFQVPLALGSQTGGSTILPAAFCGVWGYKASLTGVDRGGIRHLRPTLDTMGLFARSLGDLVLLRGALAAASASVAPAPEPGSQVRIGLCRTSAWDKAKPETREALEDAIATLGRAGAVIVEVELPPVFTGIEDSFRAISSTEGARALAAEVRDHLPKLNHWIRNGQETAARVGSTGFEQAQAHAAACRRGLAQVFQRCDVILTPSTHGEAPADLTGVSDSTFNRIWTLMHVPAVNIPAYAGPSGMPVGVQVVGPVGSDDRTLARAGWIGSRIGAGS